MTAPAPKRWLDALPEGDPLGASLRAARRDPVAAASLDRVYASVIAVAGPAGGGGGNDGATATDGGSAAGATTKYAASAARAATDTSLLAQLTSGSLAKVVAVGMFGAASLATAYWVGAADTPRPAEAPRVVSAAAASPAPTPVAPSALAPVAPTSTGAPLPPTPPSAPEAADPDLEMSLLREASASIASDPMRSLSLVHEAERRFPRGPLAQEREVIGVQALVAAGRRDEAIARARALLARNPSSAHRPRLEQLLPELANP